MKESRTSRFREIKEQITRNELLLPLDVLVVGATGAGKSSTLNALFKASITVVGEGVDPETKKISAHRIGDFLRFHDSAGLGDGKDADIKHAEKIAKKLRKEHGSLFRRYGFIDLVLVIMDGSTRDIGTTHKLLTSVILKSIESDRVIVAINQADMAMKGNNWDREKNEPEQKLIQFLDEKVESTQRRIKDDTGLNVTRPVYFSARHNYNIEGLIEHLLNHVPKSRRVFRDRFL